MRFRLGKAMMAWELAIYNEVCEMEELNEVESHAKYFELVNAKKNGTKVEVKVEEVKKSPSEKRKETMARKKAKAEVDKAIAEAQLEGEENE